MLSPSHSELYYLTLTNRKRRISSATTNSSPHAKQFDKAKKLSPLRCPTVMKLRTVIFITIFSIGVLPLLSLVLINLKGHMSRHTQVEHERLLTVSKLMQGKLLNSIKYLGVEPLVLLPEYKDALWIDINGTYLHIPEKFVFSNRTSTNNNESTANAFTDFNGLQSKLSTNKPFLWKNEINRTISWIPLVNNENGQNIFWVGTVIDTTSAQKWKQSLINNIVVIVFTTMLVVFLVAQFIALEIDKWRKEMLKGLSRVITSEESFKFSLNGPQEIKTLANDLTALCQQYIESLQARRKTANELKESEDRFRKLTSSAQDAILLMDNNGDIAYWNKAAEIIFGFESHQAMGKPVHALLDLRRHTLPPHQQSKSEEVDPYDDLTSLRTSEILELTAKRRDGKDIIIELSLSSAQIKNKWHAIWIARDISERKKAEKDAQTRQQQLIQADKMHSLGLLVSGVAHELNNPNSITMLNSAMLNKSWQSITPIIDEYYEKNDDFLVAGLNYSEMKGQIPRLFTELEESGQRVRTIVKDLKDYARQETTIMLSDVDLNSVVETAMRLTRNQTIKATSNLLVDLADDLPQIRGHKQRLEQDLINLIQNACESLPNNQSNITITTTFNQPENLVKLVVTDEGHGIPEEQLTKIIDPFFTTKRDQGGTGLGLSVSAGIIKEHNGTLKFNSTLEKGTEFVVSFPVTQM